MITSTRLGLCLTFMFVILFWAETLSQGTALLLLHRLELVAADLRFRVRGAQLPGPEVVIVAIDEKSIDDKDLGRYPWSYVRQADLVRRLTAYGAAAIGYDVVFSSSDTSAGRKQLEGLKQALAAQNVAPETLIVFDRAIAQANHDQIFAQTLSQSNRVVLGYFFHWQQSDIKHLSETEIGQAFHNLTRSTNARYTPKTAAGVSAHTLHVPTAYAVEANIDVLSQAVWGNGFFNSRPDSEDGSIRRYPLLVQYRGPQLQAREKIAAPTTVQTAPALFAPLGIRVLERYLQARDGQVNTLVSLAEDGTTQIWLVTGQQRYELPTDAHGRLVINHLGPSEIRLAEASAGRAFRFPRYSAVDIIKGREDVAPPQAFRDKIVLVGATAVGLSDLRPTPFDSAFPGVEIHATAIDNVLRQRFLSEPWWDRWFAGANILGVGIVLTLLLPHTGALAGGGIGLLLAAGSVVVNYTLFTTQGWVLPLVFPLLTVVVVWIAMTVYHYTVEQKRSRYLTRTFGTYVSRDIVEEMIRTGSEPELGGSAGVRTAYFTDIASFSSFSEILSATRLVELLNEYLNEMTNILEAEGGTLDKYEGDAIVAFFGDPIPHADHAARAIRVALNMQQALAHLRAKWHSEGQKWPDLVAQMRMRIGIHSGDFVTGNMGSTMRMNYTMMGDVVNTAARLEASAKQYGVYIHCTSATLKLAGPEDFEWRSLDKVRVVGRVEAVETVEIMALKGQLDPELHRMRGIYHQGLDLYRQQQWDEALTKFRDSDKLEEVFPMRPTNPSRVYIERCEFFKEHPPDVDWDGSWTLTSK